MSDQATAGIGDNSSRGLLDIIKQQNTELPAFLVYEHAALIQAIDDLKQECETSPSLITDDDLEKAATDLGGKLAKARTQIKNSKKLIKDAVQPGVKIVDEFFNKLDEPLELALKAVERRVNYYKDEKRAAAERARREEQLKAEAARREAEEAARRKKEADDEAARVLQDASATAEEKSAAWNAAHDVGREAMHANIAAKEAVAVAAAPAPKSTTVATGDTGAKSVQRTTWVGEIIDLETLDLNKLRHLISRTALDSAVNAFAREKKNTEELAGARIYEKTGVSFRA